MSAQQTLDAPTTAHELAPRTDRNRPIRVLLVDDHPAVRDGLKSVIAADPELSPIATAATARDALAQAERLEPDAVVVDYYLPDQDGLSLAHQLKALEHPPAVLLYSAYADPAMAIGAIVAGADGIASKGSHSDELRNAIGWIANGAHWMPEIPLSALSRMAARLEPQDAPILGMLLHSTPATEIAEVLALTDEQLDARRWAMLEHLR
jgi:DNA-binding NarL/FixJ family response regulator